MKIMYTVEDFSVKGGAENIIAKKANFLATHCGHEVSIVTIYRDEREASYPLADGVKLIRLNVPFVPKECNAVRRLACRMMTVGRMVMAFQKVLNKEQPDIIFFTLSLGAFLLPTCRTGAKKVYESHLARMFTAYHSFFLPMELRADIVVCLTSGDAKEYRHAKDVRIIPNFIEPVKEMADDYSVKKAIAVGRLEEQKGFDVLINCWKDIAEKHPDWHVDIYGEGPLRKELQAQIDRLGLSGCISLCGRSNSIMDVYPQYSLHIMPSRYEGLPMTLIEAQACGLPSVVTNYQFGASDIVEDGFNGLLVPQGDIRALIDAINRMLSSEKLRREYGRNAIEVGKRFYKDRIISQWTSLIDSLAKRN